MFHEELAYFYTHDGDGHKRSGEDDHRARSGNIAANFAALRNTAISLLHPTGTTQIARNLRRLTRNPDHAISFPTSTNPILNQPCGQHDDKSGVPVLREGRPAVGRAADDAGHSRTCTEVRKFTIRA